LPSFGEKLKKEREKRSITLEQISTSTKIGTRMLQALEEEKFNQLPGGIFNKGFVRAYARCVGLDEEQTVADYLQASGEALPQPEAVPEVHIAEPVAQTPSRGLPWGIFAAILLMIAIILSIWSYRTREHADHTLPVKPADAVPEKSSAENSAAPATNGTSSAPAPATAQTVPPAAQPAPTSTNSASSSAPATNNGSPAASSSSPAPANSTSAPSSVSTATPSPAKQGTVATATQPAATPPAPRATAPGEFIVIVRARENSWVAITADGSSVANEVMEPGSEHVIHARKQVDVRSGNTGAVDFFFNGKKLPRQGDYGQVKTISFVPSGPIERSDTSAGPQ
jgi:cytoskeleton protein RodZ